MRVYADTVYGRIYQRLYEKLDLCRHALGDFEEILGKEMRALTQELVTHRLTPEQQDERIDQTAQALANLRSESRSRASGSQWRLYPPTGSGGARTAPLDYRGRPRVVRHRPLPALFPDPNSTVWTDKRLPVFLCGGGAAIECYWKAAEGLDPFLGAANEAVQRSDIASYRCHFVYVAFGKALRGTLYPPVVALCRRNAARYVQDGHTQRVVVDGPIEDVPGVIRHDDRKPLSRWFAAQQRCAALEADHLLSADRETLSRADRLRLRAWPASFLVFLYVLLAKGRPLDGWPGWFYALLRLLAEIMLALELIARSRFDGDQSG